MRYLPQDWDVLSVTAALIGIVSTALAIGAGIQGLTSTSRSRRVLDWTDRVLEREDDSARAAILMTLRLKASRRLVVNGLLPVWKYTQVALTVVAALVVYFVISSSEASSGWVALATAITVSTIWNAFRWGLRIYVERRRIESQYDRGEPVMATPAVMTRAQQFSLTNRELDLSLPMALTFTILASLAGLWFSNPGAVWVLLAASCSGLAVLIWTISRAREYAQQYAATLTPPATLANAVDTCSDGPETSKAQK